MDPEQFRDCLLIYGADPQKWPESARPEGLEALEQSPACRALLEEHTQFEAVLRSMGHEEEPTPGLEARIIAAARRRERPAAPGLIEVLSSCFRDLRVPAPVFTAVAVLIIGVVIGGWIPSEVPTESESAEVQTFLDSAAEAL